MQFQGVIYTTFECPTAKEIGCLLTITCSHYADLGYQLKEQLAVSIEVAMAEFCPCNSTIKTLQHSSKVKRI